MSSYTLDDHCKTIKANIVEEENKKKLDQITDRIKSHEATIRYIEMELESEFQKYKAYFDSKKDEFDGLMGAMYPSKKG